jgi:hypothetical protein
MKKTLITLMTIGLAVIAANAAPTQRTRIVDQTAGTNQLLTTWMISSFTYTNEIIDVVAVGHSATVPFLFFGEDVQVAGFGTSGTNGIDGIYRVYGMYGAHVRLYRGAYSTTNVASVGTGYLTFDKSVSSFTLIGQNRPGTNNVGNVTIGVGTNSLSNPLLLTPGSALSVKADSGFMSLTNWSVSATNNNEGVVVITLP